jgi:hypothetical protein
MMVQLLHDGYFFFDEIDRVFGFRIILVLSITAVQRRIEALLGPPPTLLKRLPKDMRLGSLSEARF